MKYDYFEIKGTYEGRRGEVINTNNRVLYEENDDESVVVTAAIALQSTIETEIETQLLTE